MENAAPQQPLPDFNPPNRWQRLGHRILRLIRRIIITTILVAMGHFILQLTGWDSWEKFTKQANGFATDIEKNAYRLNPVHLWRSLFTDPRTESNSPASFMQGYEATGHLSLKGKILKWLGYYWFTDSGKAFWVGRIILVLALLAGIAVAIEEHRDAIHKTSATLFFPLNVLLKFLIVLVFICLLCIPFYYLIKLSLLIGAGIIALSAAAHSAGGLSLIFWEELTGETMDTGKKKVAAFLFPNLFGKKK